MMVQVLTFLSGLVGFLVTLPLLLVALVIDAMLGGGCPALD